MAHLASGEPRSRLCRVGGRGVTTGPPSASRPGERDPCGGIGHHSESAAASKAVNRETKASGAGWRPRAFAKANLLLWRASAPYVLAYGAPARHTCLLRARWRALTPEAAAADCAAAALEGGLKPWRHVNLQGRTHQAGQDINELQQQQQQ